MIDTISRRPVRHGCIVAAALALGACDGLDALRGKPRYQDAREIEALEVPPDLSSSIGAGARIPEIAAGEASAKDIEEFEQFNRLKDLEEFEEYKRWKQEGGASERLDFQAFLAARKATREDASGGGVRVDRMVDESRQIRIEAGVDDSRQFVETALSNMNVEVVKRDAEARALTLRLPELGGTSLFRPRGDQFTLWLTKDLRSTLVFLRGRRSRPVVSEAATAFMNRLANQVRLAKIRLELEKTVVSAASLPGTLVADEEGHVELAFDESPRTLWRRVDFIADQMGFTVVERLPERGKFVIRYATDAALEPEPEGLEKLAFWRKKKDEDRAQDTDLYTIEILPGTETQSLVRVTDYQGRASETGDGILELLQGRL